MGDLDDDGIPDLAVGAGLHDDGGSNTGAVWILFLNSDGTVKSFERISDNAGGFKGKLDPGDQFGHSISRLDDHNGDGVVDLFVSAWNDDDGGFNRGAAWILFLKSVVTPAGTFLEIKGDPVTTLLTLYQIDVTGGQISPGPNANSGDIISPDGTTVNGKVKPNGLDNYFFTGTIEITANQHVFSLVAGVDVPNNSPTTKLLEIKIDPLTTSTTTYQVLIIGQISPGPNANPNDKLSPDGTTINGSLVPTGLGLDDYYFWGTIDEITANQHVLSFVDGVEVPNGSPP